MRFLFLSADEKETREKEVNVFIKKIENEVIRNRFIDLSSLLQNVYHSLVRYLEENRYIQIGPFDAQLHLSAHLDDIAVEKVKEFVRLANYRRGFPLDENAPIEKILRHLHLTQDDRITHAGLLLFAKDPQQFFPSVTVKCAVFHGLTKIKPIPSYKILFGDLFTQINQAVEFVMGQLDFSIGTRDKSAIASGKYEIPREVIAEGIVNAIAHRDYTSLASVEVIVYRNRVEISNPGSLPLGWTTDYLKRLHNSVPHNPLIAHPLYLAGYIEQLGTGTEEMIRLLKESNLPELNFVQEQDFRVTIFRKVQQDTMQDTMQNTMQDTMQNTMQDKEPESVAVKNLIKVLFGEMSRDELQEKLQLQNRDYFRVNYINKAVEHGWIELTKPCKSTSKNQKYKLTKKGKTYKSALSKTSFYEGENENTVSENPLQKELLN